MSRKDLFVRLTLIAGTPAVLNPAAIAAVRPRKEGGTYVLLIAGGLQYEVMEDFDAVEVRWSNAIP